MSGSINRVSLHNGMLQIFTRPSQERPQVSEDREARTSDGTTSGLCAQLRARQCGNKRV